MVATKPLTFCWLFLSVAGRRDLKLRRSDGSDSHPGVGTLATRTLTSTTIVVPSLRAPARKRSRIADLTRDK